MARKNFEFFLAILFVSIGCFWGDKTQ